MGEANDSEWGGFGGLNVCPKKSKWWGVIIAYNSSHVFMLLSVLQPVCVRSENGSPRGSELSKQEQKKRPVTENCVLYISAAQRLKHLGSTVCLEACKVERNQSEELHLLYSSSFPVALLCPCESSQYLAVCVEFLNFYKFIMYIFIRRLALCYTLHPCPLKTEDFLSLLGS